MIDLKYPEEKAILMYYAKTLSAPNIERVVSATGIQSTNDAQELANFFWKMVDQTVIDKENNLIVAGQTDLDSWCEYIMQSLRSHFIATGHIDIWEDESDKA